MTNALHKHGRFFDVWSHFYRAGPMARLLSHVQRKLIEQVGISRGDHVLDLGCGPGDGSDIIASLGGVPVGLDYSEGMVAKARGTSSLRGRLLRGDAGQLPFASASFDAVVCTNSFHHYPRHVAALGEMRRVLKPGGVLGLVDPRKDHLFGWAAIDLVENAVFGLEEVRVFSVPQWYRMLSEVGFSSAKCEAGAWWNPVSGAEVFVRAVA
ncbi:MAG: class I SAM-dependent methyltransferase [Archangium sp.]